MGRDKPPNALRAKGVEEEEEEEEEEVKGYLISHLTLLQEFSLVIYNPNSFNVRLRKNLTAYIVLTLGLPETKLVGW
jgi:hypothetical protein